MRPSYKHYLKIITVEGKSTSMRISPSAAVNFPRSPVAPPTASTFHAETSGGVEPAYRATSTPLGYGGRTGADSSRPRSTSRLPPTAQSAASVTTPLVDVHSALKAGRRTGFASVPPYATPEPERISPPTLPPSRLREVPSASVTTLVPDAAPGETATAPSATFTSHARVTESAA